MEYEGNSKTQANANDDSNNEATENKSMVDKDNSYSGDSKLSGENCHFGSMELENAKMYRS